MIPARGPGAQRVLVAAWDLACRHEGGERLRVLRHPEGVLQRLRQIVSTEAPVECVLIAAGLPGLFLFMRRQPHSRLRQRPGSAPPGSAGATWQARAGLSTSCSRAGIPMRFTRRSPWPAGAVHEALLGGCAAGPPGTCRLDRWAMAGAFLIGIRLIGYGGYPAFDALRSLFTPMPFLSSRPSPRSLGHRPRQAAISSRASACSTRKADSAVPGVPEPFQGGPIQRALARAHRCRTDRRPLSARSLTTTSPSSAKASFAERPTGRETISSVTPNCTGHPPFYAGAHTLDGFARKSRS